MTLKGLKRIILKPIFDPKLDFSFELPIKACSSRNLPLKASIDLNFSQILKLMKVLCEEPLQRGWQRSANKDGIRHSTLKTIVSISLDLGSMLLKALKIVFSRGSVIGGICTTVAVLLDDDGSDLKTIFYNS